MHICVLTSSFPLNRKDPSAGPFVEAFCLALVELGHRVTVVTQDRESEEKEAPPGVPVHWFPWRGGHTSLGYLKPYRPADALSMISLFRQGRRAFDRLAAEESFDHVLAMWAAPAGILAAGMKKRHGLPFTIWCLGSDIWTYGRYPILKHAIARAIRASDLVFADGVRLAEAVTALCGRPCSFMPTSRRLNKALARPLNLANNKPLFLFIGRYAPVKGVDVLLEAMARYKASGRHGHLYMFGGGPLGDTLRQRAAQPDLCDCVTVGGYADEETFVSYLDACDCFLIPSRMESVPVVLSDSVQMGKPVIVTDVGDMGLLLRDTPAGLVVPVEDAEALSEAMTKIAEEGTAAYAGHVEALARQFDVKETARQWADQVALLPEV